MGNVNKSLAKTSLTWVDLDIKREISLDCAACDFLQQKFGFNKFPTKIDIKGKFTSMNNYSFDVQLSEFRKGINLRIQCALRKISPEGSAYNIDNSTINYISLLLTIKNNSNLDILTGEELSSTCDLINEGCDKKNELTVHKKCDLAPFHRRLAVGPFYKDF